MPFQILNSQGVAIPINDLDREACELWGKEYDKKNYATPEPPQREDENAFEYMRRKGTNWFDSIGWMIHAGNTSWTSLELELLEPLQHLMENDEAKDYIMNESSTGGLIKLIRLWESKGYIPKQVNE